MVYLWAGAGTNHLYPGCGPNGTGPSAEVTFHSPEPGEAPGAPLGPCNRSYTLFHANVGPHRLRPTLPEGHTQKSQ